MKAWIYKKDEPFLELRDIPKPKCLANCVLLKIKGVSVCGTDEQLLKGQITEVQEGIIPGHEFYGEIVQIGTLTNDILAKRGLEKVKEGSLAASESHYSLSSFQGEGVIGLWGPYLDKSRIFPTSGAYAEYITVPTSCIYPIPKKLKSRFIPSLLEPAGNDALIGQHLKEIGAKNIGIVGCGPHGLYAQVFARHFGAEKIVAFEIDDYRLKFAKKLDVADEVFNSNDQNLEERVMDFTGGEGFDAMVDTAGGCKQVLDMCIKYTKDKGELALFGLYEDPEILINGQKPNDIIFGRKKVKLQVGKRISVAGITGRTPDIWKYLIETLPKDKKLRKLLMKPVKKMGSLDRLKEDTINRNSKVLKRVYKPFR